MVDRRRWDERKTIIKFNGDLECSMDDKYLCNPSYLISDLFPHIKMWNWNVWIKLNYIHTWIFQRSFDSKIAQDLLKFCANQTNWKINKQKIRDSERTSRLSESILFFCWILFSVLLCSSDLILILFPYSVIPLWKVIIRMTKNCVENRKFRGYSGACPDIPI